MENMKGSVEKMRGLRSLGRLGKLAFGAVALGYGFSESLYNVEGGHRAVNFNRIGGIQDEVIPEGTHFRIPWFDNPTIYDVRTRPCNISSLTGSRDLQMVNVSLRVLHKPYIEHLPTIHRQLGPDYDEKVLPSIGNEVLKSVIAQYTASELLTKREQVSADIRRRLTERAKDFNLILDDVAVTHLAFGADYTAAVEQKQVAQQEAERARILVRKAEQDRARTIIKAEADAAAAQMIGKAMENNPGFLELRRLENARTVAKVISRSNNRVYLSSDTLMVNLFSSLTDRSAFSTESILNQVSPTRFESSEALASSNLDAVAAASTTVSDQSVSETAQRLMEESLVPATSFFNNAIAEEAATKASNAVHAAQQATINAALDAEDAAHRAAEHAQ